MLIALDKQVAVLSGSEALAKQRFSQLLGDNAYCAFVSYPWAAELQSDELRQLRGIIGSQCLGSVLTYTDCRLSQALLQQMVQLGISDVFAADLHPSVVAPSGLNLWPAPAVAVPSGGQHWQLGANRFARILATDAPGRLWYCVKQGIVPVLSWQKLSLPGPLSLWQAASIDCSENRSASSNIDAVVAAAAADKALIDTKLAALAQLKFIYGRDSFIYDMLRLAANDKHYAANTLAPLTRYITELSRVSDIAQRKTVLLMIKTALLLHKEAARVALQFSPLQLDFALMLAALTLAERDDITCFASQARLDWLSELLNAQ